MHRRTGLCTARLPSGRAPPSVGGAGGLLREVARLTTVADESFLRLPGGRVHLLRGGEGEPLLFLHAAGGAGRWHEFHRLLARGFEVFAPDHPGFGGSDEFADVEAIDDLVYHYLDVLDALG